MKRRHLGLAVGGAVLFAGMLLAVYGVRQYQRNADFRNEASIFLFKLTASSDRKLLVLGDSRVPALTCDREFRDWQLLNLGVGGATSDDIAHFIAEHANWLAGFQAAILWVGVNDVGSFHHEPTFVAKNILDILRRIGAWRSLIIAQIKLGPGADAATRNEIDARLGEINEILAETVKEDGVSMLTPFEAIRNTAGLYLDALHLNEEGYRQLCPKLGEWLNGHDH
jgi:lysophospholipase L1-like esterase